MGRWTIGTVQGKKAQLARELDAVELERDEDGDVIDAGAQEHLDAAKAAIRLLVESGAFPGELHVTANGYAAKGGKDAANRPTSYLSITVSSVDSATGAPRTWIPRTVDEGPVELAEGVVDAGTAGPEA